MPSNLDNYVCTKTLGEGAFGKVKEATDATGNKVAIKIFNKSKLGGDKVIDSLKKEMAIYSTLSHPHMINLIAFKENAIWVKSDGRQIEVAYMVLELITGG
jgi:serine/threonine protein kinase